MNNKDDMINKIATVFFDMKLTADNYHDCKEIIVKKLGINGDDSNFKAIESELLNLLLDAHSSWWKNKKFNKKIKL